MEKEKQNTETQAQETEKDSRLQFDAFMAGVKLGGLRTVSSIHLLVCYIVANLEGKVTAENIIQTMDESRLANHFEVADAISRLKKSGVLLEEENGTLRLTTDTTASVDLIEKDLPYTVRERSMKLCQKIIAKETFRRENKVTITQNGNAYAVAMKISDDKTDFMNLTLYAATLDQAEMIKEKFITNPVFVYDTLIEAIFKNEE